jgi:putative DNA methylase
LWCFDQPTKGNAYVASETASNVTRCNDIYITDPPYADAINYHEITEFFIAWLRKNPPAPFDQWTWDSRRSLAIQGTGEDFRRSMVEAYSAMAEHMPDNGLQCVMFTHKDTGVWGDMVSIFWAAGLQVVGAWYIATEATTALRDGAHVQGTVLLMLRKRGAGGPIFRQKLLPKIRDEVARQVNQMMHLDAQAREHGHAIFNDADLQMAGYAAALKVLTGYTEFDGQDVTTFALQPRQKGEETVVDEIVGYARQVANDYLIPERLKALNPATWQEALTPPERYYLRLLAIEQGGQFKLENHQNFAKAFQIDSTPLMASRTPNGARLKGAAEFRPRALMEAPLGGTLLGHILIAVQQLLDEQEPKTVIEQLRSEMDSDYYRKAGHLIAVAQYLSDMLTHRRPDESWAAEVVANRIRNDRFGG